MDSTINPEKFYSLTELLKFIPWVSSLAALRKWVDSDMAHDNHLKVVSSGSKTGKRYFIKGENIINYLAVIEDEGLHRAKVPEGGE